MFVRVSEQPAREYDLAAEADQLARDAVKLNVADIVDLLRFVGTWGRPYRGFVGNALLSESGKDKLGPLPTQALVAGKDYVLAQAGVDPVVAVRAEIQAWQQTVQELWSLKAKRQADFHEWNALFDTLSPYLGRMRPSMRWLPEAGRAIPTWVVETPADMLWAVFYDWATRGGQLRRCPQCEVLFPAADPRQKFCTVTCTNRASAAAWYRRKGRKLRQARRRAAKSTRRGS